MKSYEVLGILPVNKYGSRYENVNTEFYEIALYES